MKLLGWLLRTASRRRVERPARRVGPCGDRDRRL